VPAKCSLGSRDESLHSRRGQDLFFRYDNGLTAIAIIDKNLELVSLHLSRRQACSMREVNPAKDPRFRIMNNTKDRD
jgi:hypothetical protein